MAPSLVARSVSHGSLALKDNHHPPAWGLDGGERFWEARRAHRASEERFSARGCPPEGFGVGFWPGSTDAAWSSTHTGLCKKKKIKKKETKKEKELGRAVSIFS